MEIEVVSSSQLPWLRYKMCCVDELVKQLDQLAFCIL